MNPPAIEIRNLRVRYGRNGSARTVLNNFSVNLTMGEKLLVMGPNGCGKSTLLRAIAGDLDAEVVGDILLFGRAAMKVPSYRRARSLALVHQDPSQGTASHLSLGEHCELSTTACGRQRVTWNKVSARLRDLDARFDPKQPAGELSGGQRQLFTVLLAVLSAPRVLLLDEPTSALDVRHASLVRTVVREYCSGETAVVMVTHDIAEALEIGGRLIIVAGNGRAEETPEIGTTSILGEQDLRMLLARAAMSTWTDPSIATT